MASKQKRFRRPLGKRRYRKLFVLAVEGTKTEPDYFGLFNSQKAVIHIKCLKGKESSSSPPQVLAQMKKHLKEESLKDSDEAWLVVDKDQWTNPQLAELYNWSQSRNNYGFALSNPNFEYWLLLHFEDGNAISSTYDCSNRLKGHLPGYNKIIDSCKFTYDVIKRAIDRAKIHDNPPCTDWPRNTGTTVYKLVEKMLQV